jgi:ubiquinone biosynthesis accessory factor UbiJ
MLEPLAAPAINRLLRANTWALEKLRPHAGKCVRLASAVFEMNLVIADNGEVKAASAETAPDVTIAATPGVLLRLAARDDTAWAAARVSGDVQFAAALDYVRRHLGWDYEEDLSRLVGDIAAHRIAGAARELDRWGRSAALNLAHAFAEYSIHEQPMLASASAVDDFVREVDEVRDHAARLEKRVELLQRQLGPLESKP